MVYIGIDLGTTYSCVAIIENGRPVAIHNDDGRNTLPSVVAFNGNEILVGNPALDCNTNMANILYDSKRLIGWHVLHDLPIAEDRQLWTFNADTRNNCAGYILNRGTRNERFIRPEEVSAEILRSLKARAEKYRNQKVIEAVVTVPAMFNSAQITATKKAIELAGLKLKCLLQEPTAAAIAYNKKKKLGNSKLLVFDFGGGTLDISIVEIKNKNFDVKAITGDAHLGGQDFDSRIMKFVIDEFKKSSSDYDIYERPRLLKRLRIECRKAKESLSFSSNSVNVHLDINDEYEINVRLTKDKFNKLCSDLFERAMIFVDRALNMAQLSPENIDHVILVGGSTRIPKVEQNIKNKFRNSNIQFDINPDEAIAHGAAIVANDIELANQFNKIHIDRPMPTPPLIPVKTARPAPGAKSIRIADKNYVGDNPPSEIEISPNPSSQPQQIAAIGIDLGTTFSCVSVMENGRPFTIPNDHGKNTTPSIVAFDGDNILTGDTATGWTVPPTNLVYDSKRLLGWQFKDEAVQADIKTWPFKMADINGKPHYEITKGETSKYIEPEFVSAEILKYMKKTAERYLRLNNKVLEGAVITVPAYFVDRQRQATMEAAKMAGIHVLRLVTEPVAAAVAYSFQHTQTRKSTVLVYDLGGGTFDVTVAETEGSRVIVKTISGNLHLGGQDFDKNLLDYVIETFKTETGVDLTDDTKKKALKRVRAAVVRAKESLSFRENASVNFEAVNGDQDLHIKLTREDMNRLNDDLFRGTMQVVDHAINKVEPAITVDNIDQVILVGGSTRIPMVQELLIQKFGKDKLRMNVNQDEAVAQGAAILANGLINKKNGAMNVINVLPFTIGMAYRGTLMEEAFKRGTRYPCETVIYSETEVDNQTSVSQGIYQGERADCRLNIKLGQVTLGGLKRVPKGNKLETKFVIDENGMLNVTLTELATNKSSTIEISYDSEAVRNVDVRNHTTTNVIHKREDEEFRQRVLERNKIEDEVHQIQRALKSLKDRTEISAQTHEDLMKKIRPFLDWIDSLPELRDLRPRLKTLKQELAQIIIRSTSARNIQSENFMNLMQNLRV